VDRNRLREIAAMPYLQLDIPDRFMFFLETQPLWVSGAIIVGLGTLLSLVGLVLVRRCVDVRSLTSNNELAGHKFGTIGVLYAVTLAFAIIVVWEKYADAELDVVHEAGAAENIYRLSNGVSDKGAAVRSAVANYLKAAINNDLAGNGPGSHRRGGNRRRDGSR